jgi:hypothetical protein
LSERFPCSLLCRSEVKAVAVQERRAKYIYRTSGYSEIALFNVGYEHNAGLRCSLTMVEGPRVGQVKAC